MTDFIVEDLWELQVSAAAGSPHAAQIAAKRSTTSASRFLPRARLALPLDDGRITPLTMVKAPSGFGKSILLDQWADELASRDIDTLFIVAHPRIVDISNDRRGSPTSGSGFGDLLARIKSWLDTRDGGVVLVDDWHLLPPPVAQDISDIFLQSERTRHMLVLATRRPVSMPLARARARDLVTEIVVADLAISQDEFGILADRLLGFDLDPAALAAMLQITSGWPAAVDACLQRLNKVGTAAMLSELKRGSGLMDDFFREEVMQHISSQLQEFLISASVLGTLTVDSCNGALGMEDAGQLLDEAMHRGCFIRAIVGKRDQFELHPMFEQYLRSRLLRRGPTAHHAVVLRAAAWFEHNDMLAEAFDCAILAEAWDRAADILEHYGYAACLKGRAKQVMEMALKLPRIVLERHPRVAVLAARGASSGWRFGLVEDLLSIAHATNAKTGSTEVESLVLQSRMLKAQYEDDQIEAGRRCLDLMTRMDGLDHYARGTVYGSLLLARREQFDFTEATALEAAGIREFTLSEHGLGMVWHLSVAGPTHAARGHLDAGIRRLEEAVDVASGLLDAAWLPAVPALLLAEACYEKNDIARSRALLDKHRDAPLVGFIDQYIASYTTGAKLLWHAGDIDGAHRRLDEGMALAESRHLPRLRISVVAERIRLLLGCSHQDRALDLGAREQLLCGPDAMRPHPTCTTRDEVRATAWFRLALVRGELKQAVDIGQRWKRFTEAAGAVRSAMRWEILLAQAFAVQGSATRAQRELRSALGRAAAGGYIRSFLDEGERVIRLLQDQRNASAIQTGGIDLFLADLLRAAGTQGHDARTAIRGDHDDATSAVAGPLTKTQLDILQMASAGLQNREIAQRIGMTEGSVKWYMQQIFNKIGVRRRAGALERARAMGLLAS